MDPAIILMRVNMDNVCDSVRYLKEDQESQEGSATGWWMITSFWKKKLYENLGKEDNPTVEWV